jgi:hypothetical protein
MEIILCFQPPTLDKVPDTDEVIETAAFYVGDWDLSFRNTIYFMPFNFTDPYM